MQDLNNIQNNNQHKITTLDIKELHVNFPTQNIINITKFWLNINNNQNIIVKQTLELIRVNLDQNYCQHDGKNLKPTKGRGLGSPILGTLEEITSNFFKNS